VAEQDWITVSPNPANVGGPFWSPDGSLVYYFLTEGSRQYLMAVRLDKEHRPTGQPLRVNEFSGRLRPRGGGGGRFSAIAGQFIGPMVQFTYNIWMMDLPQ
jgi:hypothetical protein